MVGLSTEVEHKESLSRGQLSMIPLLTEFKPLAVFFHGYPTLLHSADKQGIWTTWM